MVSYKVNRCYTPQGCIKLPTSTKVGRDVSPKRPRWAGPDTSARRPYLTLWGAAALCIPLLDLSGMAPGELGQATCISTFCLNDERGGGNTGGAQIRA